jgi:hypothetical protein
MSPRASAFDPARPRAVDAERRAVPAPAAHRSTRDEGSPVRVAGIDFTSRPRRAKPVTVALGVRRGAAVELERIDAHEDYAGYAGWLRTPGPWVAAFDFPFGLPRELVETLGWPLEWRALIDHYTGLSRAEIRTAFVAFCAARPSGAKFAHRGCDAAAGSSSPMKWVNPPVAYMLHAGVPLLIEAGLHLPHLHPGDASRVALEGYPGLLARELIGRRSYKSDTKAKQSPARRDARTDLVAALEAGAGRLALRLRLTPAQRAELVADATADRLDAVLCMLQAAWAADRPHFGLPPDADRLEGWIVSAGRDAAGGSFGAASLSRP